MGQDDIDQPASRTTSTNSWLQAVQSIQQAGPEASRTSSTSAGPLAAASLPSRGQLIQEQLLRPKTTLTNLVSVVQASKAFQDKMAAMGQVMSGSSFTAGSGAAPAAQSQDPPPPSRPSAFAAASAPTAPSAPAAPSAPPPVTRVPSGAWGPGGRPMPSKLSSSLSATMDTVAEEAHHAHPADHPALQPGECDAVAASEAPVPLPPAKRSGSINSLTAPPSPTAPRAVGRSNGGVDRQSAPAVAPGHVSLPMPAPEGSGRSGMLFVNSMALTDLASQSGGTAAGAGAGAYTAQDEPSGRPAGIGRRAVPRKKDAPSKHDGTWDTVPTGPHRSATELSSGTNLKGIRPATCLAFYIGGRRFDPGYWMKNILWDVWAPTDTPRLIWDAWMLVTLLYVVVVTPYILAFSISTSVLSSPIAIIDLFVNACFMTDVLLNFKTGFNDSHGRLVYDRRRIAVKYIRTWFVIDVATSLPWDNMLKGDNYALIKGLRLLRIVRFLRVLRMIHVLRMMRTMGMRGILRFFDEVASHHLMRIIVISAVAAGLVHWAACIFYLIQGLYPEGTTTWFTNQEANVIGEDAPNIERYIAAAYWAVTTMTTVGFGDITPITVGERLFTMFTMVMGASIFAWFMGNMAAIVAAVNNQHVRMTRKRAQVNEFVKHRHIPRRLSDKLHNFYTYVTERQLHDDEDELIRELPNSLRMQVTWHIFRDTFEKVKLFRGKHPHFIVALVPYLKLEYYSPGDIIVRQGNLGHEMYFISSGLVEMRLYDEASDHSSSHVEHHQVIPGLHPPTKPAPEAAGQLPGIPQNAQVSHAHHNRTVLDKMLGRNRHLKVHLLDEDLEHMPYKAIRNLTAGDYFGEMACFFSLPRVATIVALEYSEVYSLSRKDLEKVVAEWPDLAEDLALLLTEDRRVEADALNARKEIGLPNMASKSYDALSLLMSRSESGALGQGELGMDSSAVSLTMPPTASGWADGPDRASSAPGATVRPYVDRDATLPGAAAAISDEALAPPPGRAAAVRRMDDPFSDTQSSDHASLGTLSGGTHGARRQMRSQLSSVSRLVRARAGMRVRGHRSSRPSLSRMGGGDAAAVHWAAMQPVDAQHEEAEEGTSGEPEEDAGRRHGGHR